MEGTDFRFELGDRVSLRPVVDASFYGGYACMGNEGVITQHRKDNNDLPSVFIEWDHNHWTYNGAPNCWTFEDHFDLVEATMPEKNNEDLVAQFKAFLETQKEPTANPDQAPTKNPLNILGIVDEPDPEPDEYERALEGAFEMLKDSESFLVVGVTRSEHPNASGGLMMPFAAGYSKSKEAETLNMAAAAQYGARAHQELAIATITALRQERD